MGADAILRVSGAAPNQSCSASGMYTGLVWWHDDRLSEILAAERCDMARRSVRGKWETVDMPLPRSLTRYARSFGCGERYRLTDDETKAIEWTSERTRERMRRCRFSIGSAPLTSITESDAQISGGETRQDYKDTRRFPLAAPSCALLFLPFGLPVSFRCYGRGFSFHA